MRPFEVAEERRAAYHAAASIASNFLVALEESAAELLDADGSRGRARAARAARPPHRRELGGARPRGAHGPIARGDEATVERHLTALRDAAPELLPVYEALAERASELARSVAKAPA